MILKDINQMSKRSQLYLMLALFCILFSVAQGMYLELEEELKEAAKSNKSKKHRYSDKYSISNLKSRKSKKEKSLAHFSLSGKKKGSKREISRKHYSFSDDDDSGSNKGPEKKMVVTKQIQKTTPGTANHVFVDFLENVKPTGHGKGCGCDKCQGNKNYKPNYGDYENGSSGTDDSHKNSNNGNNGGSNNYGCQNKEELKKCHDNSKRLAAENDKLAKKVKNQSSQIKSLKNTVAIQSAKILEVEKKLFDLQDANKDLIQKLKHVEYNCEKEKDDMKKEIAHLKNDNQRLLKKIDDLERELSDKNAEIARLKLENKANDEKWKKEIEEQRAALLSKLKQLKNTNENLKEKEVILVGAAPDRR